MQEKFEDKENKEERKNNSLDGILERMITKIQKQNNASPFDEMIKNNPIFNLGDNVIKNIRFEKEVSEAGEELLKKIEELEKEKNKTEESYEKIKEAYEKLMEMKRIQHIIYRVHPESEEKILSDKEFREQFDNEKEHDTVVISIDIRRSTELMLKAKEPKLFSKFITELSNKLSKIIIDNYGIFDKFTGDGILAFFPKFYSGEKAIVRALKAAQECHNIFNKHYADSKNSFNIVIKDVGLGIGIDYGNVTLVNTNNELTVVGIPVVYACRMSGAKAGDTLLNQPAKEELVKQYEDYLNIIETEIDIKNEGRALAYKVEFISEINIQDDSEWKSYNKKDIREEKNTEQNIKSQRKINK
jgi:hypothetical protein